ncbi:MAG: hypothetical protein CVV21_12430 [Candidatus Goldiibacteriota bacterium HGW-Goldbacteria-1]|jgi:putative nucleotidyltransferase with HDIG domain|nr:MAG: hypothetical protein CVV21_12430 [Candidatus Goldiibacteriota bacterium HGW-Goldbacteria-1]
MTGTPTDFKAISEKEPRAAVLSDIKLRWIVLACTVPLLFVIERFGVKISLIPILVISSIFALINLAYLFAINRNLLSDTAIFAVSSIVDNVVIAAALFFSGGIASPLFALYFITLIDASFDYWTGKKFLYFVSVIMVSFLGVFLLQYGFAASGAVFFDFLAKEAVLVIGAFFAVKISTEMKAQETNAKKAAKEKEILYKNINTLNTNLEKKVAESTRSLENTNFMLVKKNISLLAAHEIYLTAGQSRTREELLQHILSIIIPLMKGTRGAFIKLTENGSKGHVEFAREAFGKSKFSDGRLAVEKDGIISRMINDRKGLLINNVDDIEERVIKSAVPNGTCVISPLSSGKNVDGLLVVSNNSPGIYNKSDVELIELLSDQIGTLLQNRLLFDEANRKADGLEKLMKVTNSVAASLKVDDIISTALSEGINKLFAGSSGAVILPEGPDNSLRVKAQYGYGEKNILNRQIPKTSIAGFVYTNGRKLIIRNPERLSFFNKGVDSLYIEKFALVVPFTSKGKNMGVICITRPEKLYSHDDHYFLTILAGSIARDIEITNLYGSIKKDYINSIYALAAAVDAKDHYTHGHSTTVMNYATKIAQALNLPEEMVEDIKYAGLLHDVGKIGISESIINKPGKLTKEEFSIIKMHPQLGANIVAKIDSLKKLVPLVMSHHEWVNGTGYPLGLRAEEIPLGGRILSIADAFSTITSKRPYREERTIEDGITELRRCAGTQFDAELVEIFVSVLRAEQEAERELKENAHKDEEKEKKDKKRIRVIMENPSDTDEPEIKDDKFYS